MSPLSTLLLELGFFNVLHTVEDSSIVGTRVAFSRGSNNNVVAVYDEKGNPWIIHAKNLTEEAEAKLAAYELMGGEYVPHSNDGGAFLRQLQNTL